VNYPYDNDQMTPVYSGNRLYAKDVNRLVEEKLIEYLRIIFRQVKNLKLNGKVRIKKMNSIH
jgi:hypothetical protein